MFDENKKSPLQVARATYQPKLPEVLKVMSPKFPIGVATIYNSDTSIVYIQNRLYATLTLKIASKNPIIK